MDILKRDKGKTHPKDREKTPVQGLIEGVAVAYAITCIIFIFYAIMLTYTNVTEKNMQIIVILTTIISVAIAGFDTSRCAKEKGWFWGLIAGCAYALILIIISAIVTKNPTFNLGTFMIIIISLAGGTVGGMLGINTKR